MSKARGADRDGLASEPVLLRATGAWRHAIGGIPVLGAASVAVALAGDGTLDALSVQIRPGVSEKLDSAPIIAPELAASCSFQNVRGLYLIERSARQDYVLYVGQYRGERKVSSVRWCCMQHARLARQDRSR